MVTMVWSSAYLHLRSLCSSAVSEGSFAIVHVVAGDGVEWSPTFDASGTTGLTGSR